MTASPRDAVPDDLPAVNALIERAAGAWPLSPRVLRLTLPELRYKPADFESFTIRLAEDGDGRPVGATAFGPVTGAARAWLLHGLYVEPRAAGCGVGSALLADALAAASVGGAARLHVRAQRQSAGFFRRHGFAENPSAAYPHALTKEINPA